VKADVLTLLVTARSGIAMTSPSLARLTSYTVASVRRSLDDLQAAGFVVAEPGSTTSFSVDSDKWSQLLTLPNPLPAWRPWSYRFGLMAKIIAWLSDDSTKDLSVYAFAGRLRELLALQTPDVMHPKANQDPFRPRLNDLEIAQKAIGETERFTERMIAEA
jgi:hypothetical protein